MRSLVAMVGTNPLPVLLSCLTHLNDDLDQIILVHSSSDGVAVPGTAKVAQRIEHVLRPVLQQREVRLSLIELGPQISDINTVERLLHEKVDDLIGVYDNDEVLLDYTGGTKAMTAAAVRWHLDWVGDDEASAPARFYVDETSGEIRSDSGESTPLHLVTTLNLTTMAAVHGYALTDGDPNTRRDERQIRGWFDTILAEHRKLAACVRCRQLGVTPGREAGEVLFNKNVNTVDDNGAPTGTELTQFDLVVRWGHRVITIEAKANNSQFHVSAGWAHARTRAVFGGAAQPWFFSTGEQERLPPSISGLRDHVAYAGIEPESFAFGTKGRHLVADGNTFHRFFPPRPHEQMPPTHTAPSAPPRRGSRILVTGVGSARMAPAAALEQARRENPSGQVARLDLLTSPQYRLGEADELTLLVNALTAADDSFSLQRRQVELGSAAAVAQDITHVLDTAQNAGAEVVLDITAGPKSTTAGMVAAAHGRQGVQLRYTDARRRIRSTAGRGPSAAAVVSLPFAEMLGAMYTQYPVGALPTTVPAELCQVAVKVAAYLGDAATVWAPTRLPGVGGQYQLTLLLVAAYDRLLGLVQAPTQFRHNEREQAMPCSSREIADFGATGAMFVESLAGDASRTLLIYRRRPSQEDLRSKIEQRLAMAHPAAERPIRLCLFGSDGHPDPDTDLLVTQLIRQMYPQIPTSSTGGRP